MKTAMDTAGRIVIRRARREAAGLQPGVELEITEDHGQIQIEVASQPIRLVERDGFLAAEVEGDQGPPLTAEAVRDLLDGLRR